MIKIKSKNSLWNGSRLISSKPCGCRLLDRIALFFYLLPFDEARKRVIVLIDVVTMNSELPLFFFSGPRHIVFHFLDVFDFSVSVACNSCSISQFRSNKVNWY